LKVPFNFRFMAQTAAFCEAADCVGTRVVSSGCPSLVCLYRGLDPEKISHFLSAFNYGRHFLARQPAVAFRRLASRFMTRLRFPFQCKAFPSYFLWERTPFFFFTPRATARLRASCALSAAAGAVDEPMTSPSSFHRAVRSFFGKMTGSAWSV